MVAVFMLRHARTPANAAGVFQGQSDFLPDADGLRRCQRWADMGLPPVDLVLCSPQARARLTADRVFPGRRVGIDPRLRERNLGLLDGRKIAEVVREHPTVVAALRTNPNFAPPGGETGREVAARIAEVLAELSIHAGAGRAALVTHGGLMTVTLRLLAGVTELPVIDNLSVIRISVGTNGIQAMGLPVAGEVSR